MPFKIELSISNKNVTQDGTYNGESVPATVLLENFEFQYVQDVMEKLEFYTDPNCALFNYLKSQPGWMNEHSSVAMMCKLLKDALSWWFIPGQSLSISVYPYTFNYTISAPAERLSANGFTWVDERPKNNTQGSE